MPYIVVPADGEAANEVELQSRFSLVGFPLTLFGLVAASTFREAVPGSGEPN